MEEGEGEEEGLEERREIPSESRENQVYQDDLEENTPTFVDEAVIPDNFLREIEEYSRYQEQKEREGVNESNQSNEDDDSDNDSVAYENWQDDWYGDHEEEAEAEEGYEEEEEEQQEEEEEAEDEEEEDENGVVEAKGEPQEQARRRARSQYRDGQRELLEVQLQDLEIRKYIIYFLSITSIGRCKSPMGNIVN